MRRDIHIEELYPDGHKFWSVATGLLKSGNSIRFAPPGNSMSPFIRHGETLTVVPCSTNDLKFGDIILYSTSPNPNQSQKRIHRIMKRRVVNRKSLFFTKGDSCLSLDPPIEPNQVLGKISAIKKARWTLDLDSPLGKAINLTWAIFQRWLISMWMLRMGWKLMKSLICLSGLSGLFSWFLGEAKP